MEKTNEKTLSKNSFNIAVNDRNAIQFTACR